MLIFMNEEFFHVFKNENKNKTEAYSSNIKISQIRKVMTNQR